MPIDNRYHVYIKDLDTDVEKWFLLTEPMWKEFWSPNFTISSLAPTLPKQTQWEITMWDLTNSSVFVQYNWWWHIAVETQSYVTIRCKVLVTSF